MTRSGVDRPPRKEATAASRLRAELAALLRSDPLFASLSCDELADTVEAFELVEAAGGTYLAHSGQPLDALFVVLHGGMRVVGRRADGIVRTVRDFHRGEILGTIGLLSDRPVPVDLIAIRDSSLARLSRERFLAVTKRHPELLVALSRLISERSFNALEALVETPWRGPSPHLGNVALLAPFSDEAVREVKDRLIEVMTAEPSRMLVTAERVDRELRPGAAGGDDGDGGRVTAWMSDVERDGDVVYECDPMLPRWTARCQRQSDLVVVIAPGDSKLSAAMAQSLRTEHNDGLSRPIELVLVHPRGTRVPSGSRAWFDIPDVRAIHHVRSGRRTDVERVARHLMGRPTGIVLSGGGARGIAHVGVIAAIIEAGIPIDYVCGTSMGAIFGASLALGSDAEDMREQVSELFSRRFALYDPILPISSLLGGKKIDEVLHRRLGDADIEDLWLPFFCVSADLSRATLVVHDRGSLWKSVRASCSIPGIFPPLAMNGGMLVDGGVVDNLPLDLMLQRCMGTIIAVDVFPYGDPSFDQPTSRFDRWFRALRSLAGAGAGGPSLFDILVRSTLIGSKFRQQVAPSDAERIIYLEPPVASFGALQWRSHRALIEAGHRYATRRPARHRDRFPSR